MALCRGFGVSPSPKASANKASLGAKARQGVGDYCGGTDLEECRRMFGEALPRVCATCPD